MKFEVGDIVKIMCADKESSTPSTENKIGAVGKIIKFSGVVSLPYGIFLKQTMLLLILWKKK